MSQQPILGAITLIITGN